MGVEPKRKLVIMNLDDEQDNDGVLNMFKVFGNVIHFNRPPLKRNYAFVTYDDISSAQRALTTLSKKNVKVKYARDESMSHNTLTSTQSLDSNASVTKKTAIAGDEFTPYSVSGSDDVPTESRLESCCWCNERAGLECERCGDFYCSVGCQTTDWSRHRLICFPMPRLIRAKSTSTIIGQASRIVSATNSPQRKRVEMQDTTDGAAKSTALEIEAEPKELRKPRASLANAENEVKIAQQPVKDAHPVLTPPRKLHETVTASAAITESSPKPSAVTTNGTSPESSAATSTLKPMISKSNAKAEVTATSIIVNDDVKNGAKVKLVYANNHYSAYVRSAALDVEYADLLQRVVESAATARKLTELPKRNDMVSAPFLGDYYRAIVVKAESTDQPIRVAFLDFGNIDAVMFDDLRELPDDLKNAKRFTFRIFFDGVDRETPNKEGFTLLKHIENEVKTTFTIHSSSNSPFIVKDSMVKLVNAKTKEILNDKLAPAVTAAAIETPPAEPKPTSKSPPAVLPPTPIKKESKFAKLDSNCKRVMILDDGLFACGKVACTDVKFKKAVVRNEQIIQDCGAEALEKEPFKPKVNDRCLARVLEGEELWWFRAECLRVNDTKAQLLLLDSGKTVTITLDKIREFDAKCDFAPQTSICKIKNIPVQDGKTSPEVQAQLRQKLSIFDEFDIEHVERTDDDECLIKFACI